MGKFLGFVVFFLILKKFFVWKKYIMKNFMKPKQMVFIEPEAKTDKHLKCQNKMKLKKHSERDFSNRIQKRFSKSFSPINIQKVLSSLKVQHKFRKKMLLLKDVGSTETELIFELKKYHFNTFGCAEMRQVGFNNEEILKHVHNIFTETKETTGTNYVSCQNFNGKN